MLRIYRGHYRSIRQVLARVHATPVYTHKNRRAKLQKIIRFSKFSCNFAPQYGKNVRFLTEMAVFEVSGHSNRGGWEGWFCPIRVHQNLTKTNKTLLSVL